MLGSPLGINGQLGQQGAAGVASSMLDGFYALVWITGALALALVVCVVLLVFR
jgi:hypothetical protein